MPGINAEQPMLRGSNDDELHDSKRRRATRHRQLAAAANSSTESRTVGNAADAEETRRSSHAAHKDSEDYVELSRANDGVVCRVDTAHQQAQVQGASRRTRFTQVASTLAEPEAHFAQGGVLTHHQAPIRSECTNRGDTSSSRHTTSQTGVANSPAQAHKQKRRRSATSSTRLASHRFRPRFERPSAWNHQSSL